MSPVVDPSSDDAESPYSPVMMGIVVTIILEREGWHPIMSSIAVRKHINSQNLVNILRHAEVASDTEKIVEHTVLDGMYSWFSKQYQDREVVKHTGRSTDGYITISSGDGLFTDLAGAGEKTILLEAKRDKDFSGSKTDLLETIAQACYYLRGFAADGIVVPQATVFADVNEIFYIPTTVLESVLHNPEIDFSGAASQAGRNADLMIALRENRNINPYVHDIAERFNFNEFFTQVDGVVSHGKLERIPVTTMNMMRLFEDYSHKAFPDATMKVSNQQKIDIFVRCLRGDDSVYLHPKNKDTLVVDGRNVAIDSYQHEAFWNVYDSDHYTMQEIMDITEIADTLIEETDRRYKGDYWTPTIWVDHAHRLIEKQLGENWREDYVVWDPAAGAKNLTRDYRFGELYCSTIHQEELNISSWYNQEGVSFQYDFLNDDIQIHDMDKDEVLRAARAGELKMPAGIVEALYENRPFVFFANPPYGQHSNADETSKMGIADTEVRALMPSNYNHAKRELYTQFMYRVQLLAELFDYKENFHFFFFNKGFLTSPSFGKFMDGLTAQFTYRDGFMLNAGEFNGTSSAWGIIFSHWDINHKLMKSQKSFKFSVHKSNNNMEIDHLDDWKGNRVDRKKTLGSWFTSLGKKEVAQDFPATKNGFDPAVTGSRIPKKNWIGGFHMSSPSVQFSDKYIGMYSMPVLFAAGHTITKDNLDRATIQFSIQRSVQEKIAEKKQLWIRDKDIFTAPPADLLTPEFTADCMVYSLFDRQSNQTSLRDYSYNDKKYRVVNEFFPFSRDQVNDLALQHGNLIIQNDLRTDKDRTVYQWLQDHDADLSPEARALLDLAWEMYVESFPLRGKYKRAFPEREARYQTNTWDAGWVQVNRLIFGQDRIDDSLMGGLPEWKMTVRKLGDRIAAAAMDAGVI